MPSDRDGMPSALRGLLEECEAELRRHDIGGASLGQVYAKVRVALDELEQLRLDGVRFAPQVRLLGRDDPYECAVWLAYALGHSHDAFDLAERGRARGLLDRIMNKRPIRAPRLADPGLMARDADLRRRVRELTHSHPGGTAADPSRLAPLPEDVGTDTTDTLLSARAELLAIQLAIRDQDPAFSALRGVTPASLEDLRRLIDARTALLVYYVCANRLIIFVVTRAGLVSAHVDVARPELVGLVAQYRRCVATSAQRFRGLAMSTIEHLPYLPGAPSPPGNDVELNTLGRTLYDLLVRPVEIHLRGKTRLGVIPHAELQRVPFQALRSDAGYLIERFAVWYAPSASLLDLCHQRQRKTSGRLLAIGNPDLGTQDSKLAYAAEEVEAIAALFDTRALTGKEATLRALRERWQDADMIHLACHAEWDEQQPEFSALVLAADGDDPGRLEVHELFALDVDLPLSHVTLSACQTSLTSGSDLTGLATGFLYAGSASVVASLWPVNDLSTSELMCEFYRGLMNSDRACALQAAQLKLLRSVEHAHPYFWAAFNVIGSSLAITSDRPLAISAFNLLHRWTSRSGTGVLCHPASGDDMLYTTWYAHSEDKATQPARASAICAISLRTRRAAWKRPFTGWVRAHCFTAGLVHVSRGDAVVALRTSDGHTAWQRPTGTPFAVSLLCNAELMYVGGKGHTVCAWNAIHGDTVWEHRLDRPGSGGFVLGAGRIFVGSNDHRLYAIDAADGRLCWARDLEWGTWTQGPSWVAAGKLHTEVGVFDVDTGDRDQRPLTSPVVAAGDRLLLENLAGLPRGGELDWDDVHLLLTADLVLVSRSHDRRCWLNLFERSGGALLRSYRLGTRGTTGMSRNGDLVFVGDGDGAIQVFSVSRLTAGGGWHGSEPAL